MSDTKFRFVRVDDGYDVWLDGTKIGHVYKDSNAAVRSAWFIQGDRVVTRKGRPFGFATRHTAAYILSLSPLGQVALKW